MTTLRQTKPNSIDELKSRLQGTSIEAQSHRRAVSVIGQTPLPYDETRHWEWFVTEIEYAAGGPAGLIGGKGKLHFTFIVFPPGKFRMGSPEYELLMNYGWFLENSYEWSHAVKELRPNPRGLFDIHGNLYEWCHDGYGVSLADATDPSSRKSGSQRVYRGGCFRVPAWVCRSAVRDRSDQAFRSTNHGFRIALVPGRKVE